ncbi:MAG: TerC family protein [Candidatus Schekmanbacteria bacterium]|nr:TerC family protein [Candidatus Schekmanbacteria bacterium]
MDLGALLTSPETYASLLTLTALEVVLGIDNIVFIAILAGRAPRERQLLARRIGIAVALVSRLLLLMCISWVMRLDSALFSVAGTDISGKDLILIIGGLFLMGKATHEIYENVERPAQHQGHAIEEADGRDARAGHPHHLAWPSFLAQVVMLDVVFSLDSVITAVGMVNNLLIMATAVVLAVGIMLAFAGPIGDFVQRRASIRVLALAFLVLIGFLLITEGFDQHVPKGYVYFAMAFSLGIEVLNMRMRSRAERLDEAGATE